MRKRDELVSGIGDRIIDELFGLGDNYTCRIEDDRLCGNCRTSFEYRFGNGGCEVECAVWFPACEAELALYADGDKKLTRIEEAVQEYLDEHLDTKELADTIYDDIIDGYLDEWQLHGFRDAADYYHWRYG